MVARMSPLFILVLMLLVAVTLVLAGGFFSMLKGGEFNRTHANRLMTWRVGLQAAAIALLGLLFLLGR